MKNMNAFRILSAAIAASLVLSTALTAHAQILFPNMKQTEDGLIEVTNLGVGLGDETDRENWFDSYYGYPFCIREEYYDVEKPWGTVTQVHIYFECYLTDYIKEHDASEWPGFVIRGTDGVPFYYTKYTVADDNYDVHHEQWDYYYVKYCYDEASGWWLQDKAYKGPYADGWGTGRYVETVAIEDLIKDTKDAIANGGDIRGKAENPVPPALKDMMIDTENPKPEAPEPEDPNPGEEITDPYADINTLGATLTVSTDCIRVKKNNAPQKPMPKSVKIGKTSLKKNKNFTVSYEKYENGWSTVDAVTDAGTYRLVVTGTNGYDGICTKRLYVTADKSVKAMSSASVKINKMSYAGEPITSGVIQSVKGNGHILTEGKDYTVSYANNVEIGTAQVTLTAMEGSGLLGTKTVNFQIIGNKLSKAKINGLSNIIYHPDTGMVQDMSKVTLTYDTKTLKEDIDFTVAYTNNTQAGTAKITFTGKGLYSGTLTKSFKITKALLSENMLDDVSKSIKIVYTGKAVKPDITIKNGNITLVKDTDYTLAYSNNVKMSTDAKPAQITVKGKGNYTGSFKINFMIVSDNNEDTKTNNMNSKDATEPATDDDTTLEEAVSEEAVSDTSVSEEDIVPEEITDEEITDDTASSFIVTEEETSNEEVITDEVMNEELPEEETTENLTEEIEAATADEVVTVVITEEITTDEVEVTTDESITYTE